MNYQTIVQIIMVIIAATVIATYISPKFSDIQVIQSQTDIFKDAVDKASQSNALLQQRVQEIDSIPQADLEALELFLPNELDSLRVARDIKLISEESEIELQSLSYQEPVEIDSASTQQVPSSDLATGAGLPGAVSEVEELDVALVRQEFSVDLSGTYDQFKTFLSTIEANAYPLYLTSVNFSGESEDDGELMVFSVTFDTFALTAQAQQ